MPPTTESVRYASSSDTRTTSTVPTACRMPPSAPVRYGSTADSASAPVPGPNSSPSPAAPSRPYRAEHQKQQCRHIQHHGEDLPAEQRQRRHAHHQQLDELRLFLLHDRPQQEGCGHHTEHHHDDGVAILHPEAVHAVIGSIQLIGGCFIRRGDIVRYHRDARRENVPLRIGQPVLLHDRGDVGPDASVPVCELDERARRQAPSPAGSPPRRYWRGF